MRGGGGAGGGLLAIEADLEEMERGRDREERIEGRRTGLYRDCFCSVSRL